MRILITTGLAQNDIGGPFQYASHLEAEFQSMGHEVKVVSYGALEKLLPIGIRHIYFFLKIIPKSFNTDYFLILDTFSVGLPSIMAASLFRRKSIIRVGGDFVWSAYVNRTHKSITLPAFYENLPNLDGKEKLMLSLTRWVISHAGFLAFNTQWQKNIWQNFYGIPDKRSGVVRNFIPKNREVDMPSMKNFLWAGRVIPEKNIPALKRASERLSGKYPEFRLDVVTGESHSKVLERIKNSYAAVTLAFSDICPNFIIEAASFNKPFIATCETGLGEIYPKVGIFVNPVDEGEVERAMEALLDKDTYNEKANELKGLDLRHTWTEIAKEYIDIWSKI